MKMGEVTIGGRAWQLCLSTRVMVALEERGKSEGKGVDEALKDILGDASISGAFWLIAQMMDAAARVCRREGASLEEDPPTYDDLLDMVGVDEYEKMFSALAAAVQIGETQEIQAEFPPDKKGKNTEPTQADR